MSLFDIYLPVFKRILLITGEPSPLNNYEQSRHVCISLLEQSINKARLLDISEEEQHAAKMATVAWIDETILRSSLPWSQQWQSELLQRKYFNTAIAGERFFMLLNQLPPHQQQAREVFMFCLQQGFQGQHSTSGDTAVLQSLIEQQRTLCLPDIWRAWPNEASIIPALTIDNPVRTKSHQYPQMTRLILVTLLYVSLFFILQYYTS